MTSEVGEAGAEENRQSEVARAFYERHRRKHFSGVGKSQPAKRPVKKAGAARRSADDAGFAGFADESPSKVDFFSAVQQIEKEHAAMRAASGARELPRQALGRKGGGKEAGWSSPPGVARTKTGARPSWWDPQPLADVLVAETKRRGWQRSLTVGEVTGNWEKIVGPQVAANCPIESFEEGTLVARATSTAWAQQLRLLLPLIHKRIDEMVGAGVVEKVLVYPPAGPSWKKGRRTVQGRGPRDTYG